MRVPMLLAKMCKASYITIEGELVRLLMNDVLAGSLS
jgi:hypothetical protein